MTTPIQISLPTEAIRDYCLKWRVQELALFGSVLRDDFHAGSDVDVLITFQPEARPTLFTLVEMTGELEALLGRPIDLVTRNSVEQSANYIRKQDVLNSAQVIYAAS